MRDNQRKAMFARINEVKLRSNRLPVQVSVIVPSTTQKDKPLSTSEFNRRVDGVKLKMSGLYGGDTSVRGEGNFNLGRKLIKEPVAVVESSTTPQQYETTRTRFASYLRRKRTEWGQNSVAYTVEGVTYIYPRQKFIPHVKGDGKVTVN
jgi:hypothetical protein